MELSIEKVEVMFLLKRTKIKRSIGTIFTDSFLPSKNVKYAIENFRVEQKQITKN